MNSLMYKMLEQLQMSGGEVDIYQVCEALNITRRILTYNLEKLNYALEKEALKTVTIDNGSLKLCGAEADYERIRKVICSAYVLSRPERKALIFYQCAIQKKFTNIDQIAEWLEVSRSTLVSEMSELKEELLKAQMYIKNTKSGYMLIGDEDKIRYRIMAAYYDDIMPLPREVKFRYLDEGAELYGDNSEILEEVIWESEGIIGGDYSTDSMKEIIRYCNLIRWRNRMGFVAAEHENLRERPEYRAAGYIIAKLREESLLIDEKEVGYLAVVLLSTRLNELEAGNIEAEVHAVLEDFLTGFEKMGLISFNKESELYKMLAIHIRAMYYRVRYGIKTRNPFTKEIMEKYYGIYSITQKVVRHLEVKYRLKFSMEEIAYLSIYIGGFLKAENSDNELTKKKILLLCGSGLGTAYLLKQQIVGLLGDSYRYVIKDYRSFKSEDLKEYVMVLSTVDTGVNSANLMKVDSLMTQNQKENLLNWRLKEIKTDKSNPMNRIISIIEQYTTIQDTENLLRDLRSHVKKNDGVLHLGDVVKKEYIQIREDSLSVEEGIAVSCAPLIKDGVTDKRYITAILGIIRQYGLYFEYIPGMLLAHANAPEAVHRVGISLAVLKCPVVCDGKEIRYIFTLATPNHKDHAAALDELFKIMVGDEMKALDINRAEKEDYERLLKCSV